MFVLVILALLGVFILSVSGLQQSAQVLDVSGTRTYAGAEAGIEWGLMQVMDPSNADSRLTATPGNPQPPLCFATQSVALGTALPGVSVSASCSATSTTELNRNLSVYLITATASVGTNSLFPVSRQLTVIASRCTDPNGASPRYSCP